MVLIIVILVIGIVAGITVFACESIDKSDNFDKREKISDDK
jgi:hypothetical protein